MKIAYMLLEHFAVAVEIRDRPELDGRPLVVGGLPHERKTVFDFSAEAGEYGIKPGISLRQAYQLCPQAEFIQLDIPKYESAFAGVLETLDTFSPKVEVDGPGRAFLDLTGAERIYGGQESMLQTLSEAISDRMGAITYLGMACRKQIAKLSAYSSRYKPVVIPEGAEREFLNPLPVAILPCSEETKRRLRFFGLKTVEQVGDLPPGALAAQFGDEGEDIYRFINGLDYDPLIPRRRPRVFYDSVSFDDPVSNSTYLLAAIERSIKRLSARLAEEHRTCGSLGLKLEMEDGSLVQKDTTFRYPALSPKDLMSPLPLIFEEMDCETGVSGMRVSLTDLQGQKGQQNSFFPKETGQRKRLDRLIEILNPNTNFSSLFRAAILDDKSYLSDKRFSLTSYSNTEKLSKDNLPL